MKIATRNHGIVVATALLLAAVLSGCSQSEPQANVTPPTAANLTPQQQQGAKSSAQRDGEMRAALAKQQQSQTH